MLNELLRPKYENVIFYTHNLGRYDHVFILNEIFNYMKDKGLTDKDEDGFKVDSLLKDEIVIKLVIIKGDKKITIYHSYCLFSMPLNDLGEVFNTETRKNKFPHKFSTQDNL